MSSYRTYEEWKLGYAVTVFNELCEFLPYLWGMETRTRTNSFIRAKAVLTVPMRNGNNVSSSRSDSATYRSYRTYEEWKHAHQIINDEPSLCSYRTYEEWKPLTLLTNLPVRFSSYRTYEEWKLKWKKPQQQNSFQFLPYLWGMETHSNWQNSKTSKKFLPYLWGMETSQISYFGCWCDSSYRTYEEWKHESKNGNWYVYIGSYRTYEEWKRRTANFLDILHLSSYRTYEEWKHRGAPLSTFQPFSSYRTYEEWKLYFTAKSIDRRSSSYRTYEEWKLTIVNVIPIVYYKFLPYLWGMETVPTANAKYSR